MYYKLSLQGDDDHRLCCAVLYSMDVVILDVGTQVRNIFLEIFQDAQSPVEKRIATYLMLMKNPDQGLVRDILKRLENVRDEQLKSFVVSHLKNILNSGETQMHQ